MVSKLKVQEARKAVLQFHLATQNRVIQKAGNLIGHIKLKEERKDNKANGCKRTFENKKNVI